MLNCKKLGKIVMGCFLLALVACNTDVEPEEEQAEISNRGIPSELVGISENGEAETFSVFVIEDEDDFKIAGLMSEDGAMMFIDLSEFLDVTIEVDGIIHEGMYDDVEVGDEVRVYESSPGVLKRIVIVRNA